MSAWTQQSLAVSMPAWLAPASKIPDGWLNELPQTVDYLRDYQRKLIAAIALELDAGHSRILGQAPTGAGKTHIIVAIVMAAYLAGLRVLILATRTRLVRQIHQRLGAFEVCHGVIAARLPELRNYSSTVQVASVDTLYRRAIVGGKIPMPSADIVIFDEAHLAPAKTRLHVLDQYPSAIRIGFTATPARKSGLSLRDAFDCLVLGPSVTSLTTAGILVPTRIFNTPCVTQAELQALPKDNNNDFRPAALGALMCRPTLIGDVISNWLRIANGKRTLCFAVNKAHGAALAESFRRQGVPAEMLTDVDDEVTREQVISRLESGDTMVLINCFLMSYGVDIPTVECIVLARPTKSLVMYLQMVGRGLRASPGKSACFVIDHGHVVENLGLPQSDFKWTLDSDCNVNFEAFKTKGRKSGDEAARTCGECAAFWLTSEQGNSCPECGWVAPQKARPVQVQEADLEEMTEAEAVFTPADECVLQFYSESCAWYARRWPDRWSDKPKSGRWWAWIQTKAKFRIAEATHKPSTYWHAPVIPASVATAGWLKHRCIKWARRSAKAVA